MDKVGQAMTLFKDGFVCSQAIIAAFCDEMGLDREAALKLSAGFGGGMSGTGQACGAVTGAVMVIGLAKGHVAAKDKASKKNTYAAVSTFTQRFIELHGSMNCTELLGCDLGDAHGYRKAKESGVFKSICPGLVESAAKILSDMLGAEQR